MSHLAKVQGWCRMTLEQIGLAHTPSILPSNYPTEEFELWSVPSFPTGQPETVIGAAVGSNKQLVEPGDVLLCKINPRINRVWKVGPKGSRRQIASTEWIVLRLSPEVCEPDYLVWALREPSFRERLCAEVSGVGGSLTRARPAFVKELEVAVPPLDEQRRMAARIEEAIDRSRRVRGALRSALDEAGLLKTTCLEGAYQDASSHATSLVAFGSVLEDIRGGTTLVPADEVSSVKVLRSSAVRPGAIDWNDARYLPHAEQVNPQHLVQDGDLLITRLSGSLEYVGNMAVVQGVEGRRIAYPDRLFRARLRPGHVGEFYTLLFAAPSVRKQLEPAAKSSAGHQRISISNVEKVTVPLCDEHTQRIIAESTLSQLQRIGAMLDAADMAYQRLGLLEQAILSAAFSHIA